MAQRKEVRSSQELIDTNLKQIFQETVDQDVPDRFKVLIEKLRGQDQQEDTAEKGKE